MYSTNWLTGGVQWHGNWNMGPGMMGWGGGWFGSIFMIIFWVVLIVALVALTRWLLASGRDKGDDGKASRDEALDILRKRYARGELDKEEFEQRKRDLLE